MPEITIGPRKLVGEHILSEANETRSREHIWLAATTVLIPPGTILGKIEEGNVSVVGANVAGMVGNSVFAAAPTADPDAAAGVYRATFLDADTFEINGPAASNYHFVGQLGAAVNGPVNFTRNAGATPAAAGDEFTITVSYAAGSGLFVPLDPTAQNGAQDFAGILFHRGVISDATQRRVGHVRDCEVNEKKITLLNALSGPQLAAMKAQAAAVGVLFSGGR